ncbi:molybdenum cofactor guanylyltransferase [Arthrobacter mobilis]|uniref:molybdenum cofactor guanylyltransferase n=1 Tax=Arthrobacter mobilis TaxID=2724944 RepID=UPI0028A731B1|nr:NTP transferase domain-containing protein [Arthrobacter mobilis]
MTGSQGPDGYDAVVLAGGRSSRLGGVPKALLQFEGRTLLHRTLDALAGARRIAVVGPPELSAVLAGQARTGRVLLTREDPPFAGPAAGIAAGTAALATQASAPVSGADLAAGSVRAPLTLLLACDMPRLAELVPRLLAAVRSHPGADLWVPVDAAGREQPLACCARSEALEAAVAAAFRTGGTAGLPARKLLAPLAAVPVPLPAAATEDVDTWEDAGRFGIVRPAP